MQIKQAKVEKHYIIAIDCEDPLYAFMVFLRGNQLCDLQLDSRTSNSQEVAGN